MAAIPALQGEAVIDTAEIDARARRYLDIIGLSEFANYYPLQLSGEKSVTRDFMRMEDESITHPSASSASTGTPASSQAT